jgi:hypothetical protein
MLCFYFSWLSETNTPREWACLARRSEVLGVDRVLDAVRFEDEILSLAAGPCGQGAVFVFDAAEGGF